MGSHSWKRARAMRLLPITAILISLTAAPALATKHTAHPHASNPTKSGFYQYGIVCGENDASLGESSVGSISNDSDALDYMSLAAHRQELPPSRAESLVHQAQSANSHQREQYLDDFRSGYKAGWGEITNQIDKGKAASAAIDAKANDQNDASLHNLSTIGLAVHLYLADHNNTFPRMATPEITDKYFQTYLQDDSAFYQPGTDDPYVPNVALENRRLGGYEKWGKTVVYYEQTPARDGSVGVLFVDGTVARISADQWPTVKKNSGIPDDE